MIQHAFSQPPFSARYRLALLAGLLVGAAATTMLAGCSVGEPPVVEADSAPDATVEKLVVSSDGSIQHEETGFADALAQPGRIVVVDFWATWCGPCVSLAPELETVAAEMADSVTVVKVNVDEHDHLARHFQINAIPDIRFFRDGKPVGGMLGFRDADGIISRLKSLQEQDTAGG